MLRETVESIGSAVLDGVGRAAGRVQERTPLPVDLLENDEAFLAVFDAPGATASDIQVRFEDNTVSVRIDRFRKFYEGFEMRFPGRGLALDGQVQLPDDAAVDPDAATATLTDSGTLEIHIPKLRDDSGIEIETQTDRGDETAE